MTSPPPILSTEGLRKAFGASVALAGVSVDIRPGEVHGIVGHNGAGKSTLMKILAGAIRHDSGRLVLGGADVSFGSPAEAAAAGVVCVYQELSLLPNLSVAQNLFLGRELSRAGWLLRSRMRDAVARQLSEHNIKIDPEASLSQLPVAQRQMVEIVGALGRDAKVILLDEPTTALESSQIDDLLQTLRGAVRSRGVAVVIVDHKLDEIFAVSDRITALTDGQIVLSGPASEVSREQLVDSIVGSQERSLGNETRSAEAKHRSLSPNRRAALHQAENLLRVRGIGARRGLRGVTFELKAGEILGVYGLAGSGRTRLLKSLYGLEPIETGSIHLKGQQYVPKSPRDAMRAGVAFVSEERKADGFVPQFDSVTNCVLPTLRAYARYGVIRRRDARSRAEVMLKSLGIRGDIYAPIVHLSGGNQQKVLLAKAVVQRPSLLLLDEPTKGIDVGTKAEIHSFIKRMAAEENMGVVVVSTEEEEILSLADDVIVMHQGRCDGERHPSNTLSEQDLRRLALGVPGVAEEAAFS